MNNQIFKYGSTYLNMCKDIVNISDNGCMTAVHGCGPPLEKWGTTINFRQGIQAHIHEFVSHDKTSFCYITVHKSYFDRCICVRYGAGDFSGWGDRGPTSPTFTLQYDNSVIQILKENVIIKDKCL